jgi:hypothetical protein
MNELYTQDQKIFTLSILSNLLGASQDAGLDKILLDLVTEHLAALEHKLGAWRVVWGPCVYQVMGVDRGAPANVMYVAQDQAGSELAVAIAGTNSGSLYAWLAQNFNVMRMVQWEGGDEGAQIARGTSIGLSLLQDMRPRATVEAHGTSLIDFLQQWVHDAGKPVTVTITGHSLGGALSTVTGLWLKNEKSTWDPHNRATLKVWSSGGPTPGNAAFARYYDEQLGDTTTRFSNSLDPIPHAWTVADLLKIMTLYSDIGGPNADRDVILAIRIAVELVRSKGYTHILVNTPAHQGKLKSGLDFLKQFTYQHGEAYCVLVGARELIPIFQREPATILPPLPDDEEAAKAVLEKMAADADAILELSAARVRRR